ncbi:MAG: pyridoxamine 5'-phosphate oxidase [Bdellovibrionales bacterium]|nr:pyridoxamine 5'-phosphate oxidase [Bdellovibrionales bacterium]
MDDPLAQLDLWVAEARARGMSNPDAMSLATSSASGTPTVRVVLYKGPQEGGLSFFTNYGSAKSRDLESNPRAAAVFYWREIERQVRVEGEAKKLSREASERYFASRDRGSQIGAWASHQSRPLGDRSQLEARVEELEREYAGSEIPCPPQWGGYVLVPAVFEFWIGRMSRLHDRYRLERANDSWKPTVLNP